MNDTAPMEISRSILDSFCLNGFRWFRSGDRKHGGGGDYQNGGHRDRADKSGCAVLKLCELVGHDFKLPVLFGLSGTIPVPMSQEFAWAVPKSETNGFPGFRYGSRLETGKTRQRYMAKPATLRPIARRARGCVLLPSPDRASGRHADTRPSSLHRSSRAQVRRKR